MKSNVAQWAGLALFLVICFIAAATGSLFTAQSIRDWYPQLEKPWWTPPNQVFAPAWTFLYTAMALAAWLVWRRHDTHNVVPALSLFTVQLVLNVAWSGLFFGLRNPLFGFLDILLLWGAILATLIAFWRINVGAGALFVPYLAWVTYAGALNGAIWLMNP